MFKLPAWWVRETPYVSPGLFAFIAAALLHIRTPGIYMDAVNPDYMIVRLLYGSDALIWILPGSLLFGKFPLLVQLYHGALTYYVGLPVYFVLGTGMVGIRFANAFFGSLVLLALYSMLRRFGAGRFITGLAILVLAIDPAFLFSFRMQFYILLLPVAFVFTGIALVESRVARPALWTAMLAGLLTGLAAYGYFVFMFLAPACAAHALMRWWRVADRERLALGWLAGILVGASPFPIGYYLIYVATGGWDEMLAFVHTSLTALAPASSPLSLVARFGFFLETVRQTVLNVGPEAILLKEWIKPEFGYYKLALLLGAPALGALIAIARPTQRRGLLMVAGWVIGLLFLFLIFGSRLWLSHTVMLLPICYAGVVLATESLAYFRFRLPLAAMLLIGLAVGNLLDDRRVYARLDQTGGVGLASDAIENFSTDMAKSDRPIYGVFPDWGVFMPFAMLTRGRIPYTSDFEPQLIRNAICSGRDVVLALTVGSDRSRLLTWISQLGLGEPEASIYTQRDSVPVLDVYRWRAASQRPEGCV